MNKISTKTDLNSISKIYTTGISVLPAAAGSAITFMYVFAALAGIIDVLKKRISTKLDKFDKIIVYPAVAFFVVNALSIIRFDFKIQDLVSLVPSALFILPYFFIKRYRYISEENHFLIFLKMVPFGAFLLLPWILYEGLYLGQRMEAGAGNAIPFAMICALMLPICLMNLISGAKLYKIFAIIGFIIFGIGLAFSQTRSMYIATIPNILIAFAFLIYETREKLRVIVFASMTILISGLFVLNSSSISSRFEKLAKPLQSILHNAPIEDRSVGDRFKLLKKGICFAQSKPITGYGISNRIEILTSSETQKDSYFTFCNESHGTFTYSHFHNGFLTSFIDAGIFGLISTILLLFAPITLAIVSPRDEFKSLRICTALCLTSIYLMAAFTNLLFGHDLIDGLFLTFATFLALSIKPATN